MREGPLNTRRAPGRARCLLAAWSALIVCGCHGLTAPGVQTTSPDAVAATDAEGSDDDGSADEAVAPAPCVEWGELCLEEGADEDGDGLTNRQEIAVQTDPLDPDTDGDGLIDSYEVGDGSEPLDTDGDGTIDALEHRSRDLDCDGLSTQEDTADDPIPEGTKLVDADGDGVPETCVVDTDEDGLADDLDCDPTDAAIGEACPESPCVTTTCELGVGCLDEPVVCEDYDLCTIDTCNVDTSGCEHTEVICDSDPCTDDVCLAQTGVCVIADKDCGDNDPCTADEHCEPATGECFLTYTDCDDEDPCTTEVCHPISGSCEYTAVPCDDADPCTTDSCDPLTGACVFEPKACDDDDPCTDTVCDPETGWCSHPPTACDDLDACTTDSCDAAQGGCLHDAVTCDDDLLCTDDSCEPTTGCVYEPKPCEDDDPCTTGSCVPEDGACEQLPVPCDDDDPCTTDACITEFGACAFEPKTCDDEDPCTDDTCEADTGDCLHVDKAPTALSFAATDDAPGLALWSATDEAPEGPGTGHPIAACDGAPSPYFLASSEYADLTPGSLGAAAGLSATSMDALEAHLATLGLDLSDLTLRLGLGSLGYDVEGVDWEHDVEAGVETRHYQGVTLEVWLGDKPLVSSTLGTVTATVDHSTCAPLPRPMTLESGWAFAVDLTDAANANTKLAAQLLLQALGVPAKIQLHLELTTDDVSWFDAGGRTGHLVGSLTGTLAGQTCAP